MQGCIKRRAVTKGSTVRDSGIHQKYYNRKIELVFLKGMVNSPQCPAEFL